MPLKPRLALPACVAFMGGVLGGVLSGGGAAARPTPTVVAVHAHRVALYGDTLLESGDPTEAVQVATILADDLPTTEILDFCVPQQALDILERVHAAADARADVVVVSVGARDATTPTVTAGVYSGQVAEMLHTLAPARVVVILPPNFYRNPVLQSYSDATRSAAIEQHATVIDPGTTLKGGDYAGDGTALSPAGRRDLATLIEAQL